MTTPTIIETRVDNTVAKLLMACASNDAARETLQHIHVENVDNTQTFVATNTHVMCVARTAHPTIEEGDYLPSRPTKDFWMLKRGEVQFPNWKRILLNKSICEPIAELHYLSGTKHGGIRAWHELNVSLAHLDILACTKIDWTIYRQIPLTNNIEKPMLAVPSSPYPKWDLQVVIMPINRNI